MIGPEARRMPCASLLLSLAAAFIYVCPSLADHLEYDRTAIAAGEIWRLFSGHWVHYGVDHFFWDVLAFGFLAAACERRSRPRLFVCVIASALAISVSVWFGLPGMNAYRGLSGIDSALVVLLFMELWSDACRSRQRKEIVIPAACLAAFVCKVSFELATGDTLFVKSLESGMVGVPLAHVAGAAVGFLVGLGATSLDVLRWLKMSPAPERTDRTVGGARPVGCARPPRTNTTRRRFSSRSGGNDWRVNCAGSGCCTWLRRTGSSRNEGGPRGCSQT